jgi:hypothetical protein
MDYFPWELLLIPLSIVWILMCGQEASRRRKKKLLEEQEQLAEAIAKKLKEDAP